MAALLSSLTDRGRDDGAAGPLMAPGWLAVLGGLAVTVAGLAGLTVAVLVVQTLDPEDGLSASASMGVAGRLWLLAQGGTLELPSGPFVLAPLLLTLLIAWGLAQAGRWVVRAGRLADPLPSVRAGALLIGTHVVATVGLALVLDLAGGGVGLLRAVVGAAVLAVVAAGWGVCRESGLVDVVLDRLPGAVRPLLRAVLTGALVALALCTAVVAVAVASDSSGYAALSSSLGGAGAGAVGLLALGVLLLPNAAAAVLGLAAGPGFAVGGGTLVSVHGVTLGAVPALPLLAGLPDTQAVPLLAFASQAIPALTGLVTGAVLGRTMRAADGGSVVAGLWGVVAGALLGVLSMAATWAGGGSLGDGELAVVGAAPLATGIAVAVQTAITAAPSAVVTRWRNLA